MILLSPNDYHRVKKLFNGINHNVPIVYALLNGNTSGMIYVDDINNPQTTFMYLTDCFCYVIGESKNSNFNKQLKDFIHNVYITEINPKELVIFTFCDAWHNELCTVLSDLKSITIKRVIYDFIEETFSKVSIKNSLPKQYSIKKYNSDNINSFKVLNTWLSTDKFLQHGLGMCITNGNETVATCYSVYAGNNNVEIDIFTKEEYRGKGYATLLAYHFIKECLKLGLVPNWSCWPHKKESMIIAEKLGFANKRELPVHLWACDL